MKTIFRNARIITPSAVLENHRMTVEHGRIVSIEPEDGSLMMANAGRCAGIDGEAGTSGTICAVADEEMRDVSGCYLLPGFIDIHSDMIEGLLQPRSTAMMDFAQGLSEAEKQLAACGITTIFHSVSMFREGSWDSREIRTALRVKELAGLVKAMGTEVHLIHNRYHLRYELDNLECFDEVMKLIEEGYVQLLSLMDHRPGQGQYRNLSVYRRHLPSEGKNLTDEEFFQLVKGEAEKPMLCGSQLCQLVELAQRHGIPVASHDDDTLEKIEKNQGLGVTISEFPISLEVARAARNAKIAVLLGAPNILLGGSHSGNLSAEEAIQEGCADILCSDYYPQALLRAVFYLAKKGVVSLPQACRFVSKNPADAVGIGGDTGSLEVGKVADFLVVETSGDGSPRLLETWASGRPALRMGYDLVSVGGAGAAKDGVHGSCGNEENRFAANMNPEMRGGK